MNRNFLWLITLMVLSGGVSFFPEDPKKFEQIHFNMDRNFTPQVEPVTWQLLIEAPRAELQFNTDRIIVKKGLYEFTYVDNARWVDQLSPMVQDGLLELFENSGKILGVGLSTSGLQANYVLMTDIREFQLEAKSGDDKHVYVAIGAKVLRLSDRMVMDYKLFQSKVPIDSNSVKEVSKAFCLAMNNVAGDIVTWTLTVPSEKEVVR